MTVTSFARELLGNIHDAEMSDQLTEYQSLISMATVQLITGSKHAVNYLERASQAARTDEERQVVTEFQAATNDEEVLAALEHFGRLYPTAGFP